MITAVVNLAPGTGRTTLAVNLAGELVLRDGRVMVLDIDGDAGALDWAALRQCRGLPPPFPPPSGSRAVEAWPEPDP